MTARLRMFAGPNGSRKSTVKSIINPWLLDLYLNPDEIEKQVLTQGVYDVRPLTISLNSKDIIQFFQPHPLGHRTALYDQIEDIHLIGNQLIDFKKIGFNSYFFDNSGSKAIWIAEITNGTLIDLKVDEPPEWFVQAVLNKI